MGEGKNGLVVNRVAASAIERLRVDRSKPLTSADKNQLLKILDKAVSVQSGLVRAVKEQIKREVLSVYKKESGFNKLKKELAELEAKVEAKKKEIALTGFSEWGELGVGRVSSYGFSEVERKELFKKVKEMEKAVESATESIESYETNIDKLRARLILSSTYGDALVIMNLVFGNKDGVLKSRV